MFELGLSELTQFYLLFCLSFNYSEKQSNEKSVYLYWEPFYYNFLQKDNKNNRKNW